MATTFAYSGKNASQKTVKGTIAAENAAEAKKALKAKRITVTELKEEKAKTAAKKEAVVRPIKNLHKKAVDIGDLVVFTRQLATLVQSGVPFGQSLETLRDASEDPVLAQIIQGVHNDVSAGMPLYEAMQKYPKTFGTVFTSLVMAGEEGGILETVLLRLASYFEKEKKIKTSIKKAMVMPMVTMFITGVVVVIMMIFVVPMFQSLYAQVALPLPTQILVFMSENLRKYWYAIIPGIVGLVFAIKRFLDTPVAKVYVDRFKWKMPVFKNLFAKSYMANFSMTLSSLLTSGLPIIRSLEICIGVVDNVMLTRAINNSITSIQSGETLSAPLEASGYFPKVLTRMILVGEETGNVDGMLLKASEMYEAEVEALVANLSALLEPLMTVFIAMVIGFVLFAMYLPMFSMFSAFKGG